MPALAVREGFILEKNSRFSAAIRALERALSADPTNLTALKTIGKSYFALGKYEEAIKTLVLVDVNYAAHPQWASKALLEIGRSLKALGRHDEARQQYEELVKKYPQSLVAASAKKLLKEDKKKE